MKKIIFICTLLVSLFAMSGCSDDIDTPVLTTDEYPRILGRWPDKQEDGTLGKFSIPLNQVLSINVQYTPAELCEGTWYLDGREIHKGVGYYSPEIGLTYITPTSRPFHLELIVKTPTKETTREAIIQVTEATE